MRRRTVLIADDCPADLGTLSEIVRTEGWDVVTATSGFEAIATAWRIDPNLIFLDMLMPDMDGFEACHRLTANAKTRHIPIILVAGKGQTADRLWARMQGGKDLVHKPLRREEILVHLCSHPPARDCFGENWAPAPNASEKPEFV